MFYICSSNPTYTSHSLTISVSQKINKKSYSNGQMQMLYYNIFPCPFQMIETQWLMQANSGKFLLVDKFWNGRVYPQNWQNMNHKIMQRQTQTRLPSSNTLRTTYTSSKIITAQFFCNTKQHIPILWMKAEAIYAILKPATLMFLQTPPPRIDDKT